MWRVAVGSWHWISQVAAPSNVEGFSGIIGHIEFTQTSAILVFCIWFRVRSYHCSRRHSAPVCKILSKSDHPRQKKMTSCQFSRWRISTILDFRGPVIGSLKSLRTTSYRSSIETIALICLVFEKIACFVFWRPTDGQTDEQMDSIAALSRFRCRERRLNNCFHRNTAPRERGRVVSLTLWYV